MQPLRRWLVLWVGVGALLSPVGAWLVDLGAPSACAVQRGLLEDFGLLHCGVGGHGLQRLQAVVAVNRRHLVVDGQVVGPGFRFEAVTPASTPRLHLLLLWAGAVLGWGRLRRPRWAAMVLLVMGAGGCVVVLPALVLAGQVIGLVDPQAALAQVSRWLLAGAGTGCCAVVLLAICPPAIAPVAPTREHTV